MFKLVIVSGLNSGASFFLKKDVFRIGRQSGNDLVLSSSHVSKQHCEFSKIDLEISVKDLGSSNGTYVNGALVQERRLVPGDRISIGDFVLELFEVKEKSISVGESSPHFREDLMQGSEALSLQSVITPENSPFFENHKISQESSKDLKSYFISFFENGLMSFFYSLNLKYQWKYICIVIIFIYILGNLVVSVYPLLESNRVSTLRESSKRASFMAKQIADQNSSFLASRMETKTDLGIIEHAEGVKVALIVDLDNRIIAPAAMMNQYLAIGEEAIIAVTARNLFRAGRETGFWKELDFNSVVAIEPIKIYSPLASKNIIVAMAIVSIDASLSTLSVGEIGVVYAKNLILNGILGIFIFLVLYKLTLKPFEKLNQDMDKALKGDIAAVSQEYQFEEMNALWDIINSAIQRIPKEMGNGRYELGFTKESLNEMPTEYLGPIKMIGSMGLCGLILFDSAQKIAYLNAHFEELSGIRFDGASGQEISAVSREQSLSALVLDLFSRVSTSTEEVVEDYDFSGIPYKVSMISLGTSGAVKGYLLMVVKSDS